MYKVNYRNIENNKTVNFIRKKLNNDIVFFKLIKIF